MSNRPAIPAEITREILLESGHRCAVCGTPCPLERAHIVPWHKSREHKAEDLICLCANCHERADKEKWGQKTLREYKRRPWVLRQYKAVDGLPEPTVRLQVTIGMELERFDEKNQRWLQHAIAAFLEIPPHTVEVIAIERGSVKVIIELPKQSANRLLTAYQGNDPELAKYFAPLILVDLRRETAGLEGTHPDHGDAARPLHEVEWQLKRGWLVGMGRILRSPVFQGVVAVLALVVAIGTWFWPDIRPLLFPSSHSFAYQVRVQTKDTGEYVQGAEVTIEVGGQAPLDDVTDSSGLARILIPSSHANRPGKLIVEATGYERRVQHIDLTQDALPDVVQLEQGPPPPDAVVSVDALELREGPVVVYRALGSYPNGTPLEVLGKEPEERWLKVRTPDVQTGWMFAQHLRVNIAVEDLTVLMMARPPCPCQANTDPDTIVCLIEAESKAADDEDISIIHAIFASNATIRDAARDEEWDNPIVRYEQLFRETDFEGPTHLDILPAGPGVNSVGSIAWFTSGSTGRYVTYDGHSGSYDNPPGSDHWTLRRDSAGCWVIINFTFNASHIPFPP